MWIRAGDINSIGEQMMRISARFVNTAKVLLTTTIMTLVIAPAAVTAGRQEGGRALAPKAAAPSAAPSNVMTISATVETEPVKSAGDAADDPAIWINPANSHESTIIGTDKQGGLAVYDLSGKQIQYLPDGRMNNVDIRTGFTLGGQAVALVTASNRTTDSIAIYRVNPSTRMLENVAARAVKTVMAYGSCMYRSSKSGKFFYIVTSKTGVAEQWELFDNGSGKVDARKARELKVGTVIEGCVADDELGHLYIAEESVGIWKYGAEPETGSNRKQVDKTGTGGYLTPHVEGLAIAYGKEGKGYLFASSQGNNSFVVYRREGDNEYVKSFSTIMGNGIDEVSDTDGIEVTLENLGPAFPHGLFIAQDGTNDKGNQNFKLYPLQLILGDK